MSRSKKSRTHHTPRTEATTSTRRGKADLSPPPPSGGRPSPYDNLNFKQACAYLNVNEKWLRNHIADIPHWKAGQLLRFTRAALDEYITANWVDAGEA
jgi:excisionase family DNA binding protein